VFRVVARMDGLRRCDWEHWLGPDVASLHPWREALYLSSNSIADSILSSVCTVQDTVAEVWGSNTLSWRKADEALIDKPLYPSGTRLKIKLDITANIPACAWPVEGYSCIYIVGTTGHVCINFFSYNGMHKSTTAPIIYADDNGGEEQVFDLSPYISDILSISYESVLHYSGGVTESVYSASITAAIDYFNFG